MSAVPAVLADAKVQKFVRDEIAGATRFPPNNGAGNNSAPPAFKPSPISAEALLRKEFPPIKWTIKDILPEGVFLLTARPKIGKSWLALQTCIGVASGRDVLNRATAKGSALYLALEDNERRLQQRLFKYRAGHLADHTSLQRVEFVTDWRRSDEGGLEDISAWLDAHPDARLVVIDTLERFRPRRNERANAYGEDYAALSAIKTIADTRQITVLVVHHNRKAESEDPLDAISGTLGISGAADGALVLTRARGSEQAELHLIGRDIAEEGAYAVVFERKTCMWTMQGAAAEVAKTRERQQIIDLLRLEKRPMRPKEIAEELDRKGASIRRLLQGLLKEDKLQKDSATGAYSLP
jgi:RecA-family ATPase